MVSNFTTLKGFKDTFGVESILVTVGIEPFQGSKDLWEGL